MASGTILGHTSNEYIQVKVEWSSTRNYDQNTSTVFAALYYKRSNEYTTSGTGNFYISIGGYLVGGSKYLSITDDGWVKAAEGSTTVQHRADGSQEVHISATGDIPGTTLTSTTLGATVVLDTIHRASTITSVSEATLGQYFSVVWTPLNKEYRYRVKLALGSWSYDSGVIHPNQLTAFTHSVHLSLELLKATNGQGGTMKVTLCTYSNSAATNQVGDASTKDVTVTVPTIASTISSATNTELGQDCYVKWTPLSTLYRYKLKFTLGDWSVTTGAIHPNKTTEYTHSMTIPLDVANQITTSKTGIMSVSLYTYYDTNATQQGGDVSTKNFAVTVPYNDATKPTVSMSVSPLGTPSVFSGLYLQGISKVKATINSTTKYGATVESLTMTVNGVNYESPFESAVLSTTGKVEVKATVKDSRGFYGTYYQEIEVIPYAKPYIQAKSGETEIIAKRCDASANFTDSGTYLKIKAKVAFSKVVSGGVQKNKGIIKYRYRVEGGAYSSWVTILDGTSDEVITGPLLNGALDVTANYQVQILASDYLYDSAPVTIAISSDAVYMEKPAGGKSMGLGGYSTGDGRLDVYWKTMARGGLSLFSAGNEIPLDTTMPLPRDQLKGTYNPDSLENGIHIVANNNALKTGDTVIMYNGLLIQMPGNVDGSVKLQLALPADENRNPMYRLCWYSNWSTWRSLKL